MPAEHSPPEQYQHLVHQAAAKLRSCTDDNLAPARLLALCQQLSKLRLTLSQSEIDLWQHRSLDPVIKQTELLWQLGQYYRWPVKIQQLMLLAGFCAALSHHMPQAAQWPKLQRYPALLAAKLLSQSNNSLQLVLAGCYPTERAIPLWQQQMLSVALTVTDHLSHGDRASEPALHSIGVRIALSKSDYELAILRRLLSLSSQPLMAVQPDNVIAHLSEHSQFQQLCNAGPRQLPQMLSQSDAMMQPILQLATSLNRQQQKVSDVRLALNLLGQDRLPYVLAHAELHQLLLDYHHPLQVLFEQTSNTLAEALLLLQPGQLSDAASRALALCLCVPLWMQHDSGYSAMLRRSNNGWQSALDTTVYNQPSTVQIITSLLQHYQMTLWQGAVTDWLHSLHSGTPAQSRQALALQLAWHSTIALLGSATDRIPAAVIAQAQQHRILTVNDSDWLMQLASQSQCQYPLLLTL